MRTEAEVYRFTSSVAASMVNRWYAFGRQVGEITLRRTDRQYALSGDERPAVALTLAGWARVQDVLIATSFWALDPEERR
jgi:hypothetical protein